MQTRKKFVSKYDLSIFNSSATPDIVALFLMDVREVPLLTADEEVELAIQIEQAKVAKKKLLSSNKLTYSQKEEYIQKIEFGRDAFNLLITAKIVQLCFCKFLQNPQNQSMNRGVVPNLQKIRDTIILQCAIEHSLPLISLDQDMINVAKQEGIQVLEV